MQQPKKKRRWMVCPACHIMIFAETNTLGNHVCPLNVRAKKDAELDAVIDVELSTWNEDLDKFWDAADVKFTDFLLRKGKY